MPKREKGKKAGNPKQKLNVGDSQKLPPKLQSIFDKRVLGEYEDERFDMAIKEADRILESHPAHGETLAMKGLCFHTKGDKEKGMELIQAGLKHNMKSSLCWRVKGVAHKSDEDLESAVKCYKQALLFDKNTQTRILNEMGSLQLQLRDYKGFEKTRSDLWKTNKDKATSVSVAVACFLSGNYQRGVTFLEKVGFSSFLLPLARILFSTKRRTWKHKISMPSN